MARALGQRPSPGLFLPSAPSRRAHRYPRDRGLAACQRPSLWPQGINGFSSRVAAGTTLGTHPTWLPMGALPERLPWGLFLDDFLWGLFLGNFLRSLLLGDLKWGLPVGTLPGRLHVGILPVGTLLARPPPAGTLPRHSSWVHGLFLEPSWTLPDDMI